MRKTGDFVKLKDKSMYFPKVKLTYDELYTLYVYGHASPQFLYQVVVDSNMVDKVICENCKSRPNKKDGYKYLLDKLKKKIDEVQQDLLLFSKGKIDLIDVSVKYGFYYYDLKKAFSEVLDVDVNEYWKQHKKYVQKHTCLELYGVDSSAKVADIQAKQKATVKAKYGAENIMQTDTGKKRLQKTMMERYGVPCNLMARDDVYDFSKRCYDALMGDNVWVRVLKKLAQDKKVSYDMLYKEYPLYRRDFILSMQVSDHIETLCKAWKKVGRDVIKYPTNTFFKMPVVMVSTFLNEYAKKGLISLPSNFNCFKSQYELMVTNYRILRHRCLIVLTMGTATIESIVLARRFGNFQDKSNMFIDYPLTRERINAKQSVSRLWGKACVLENVGRKIRGLGAKIAKIDK